MYPRQHTPTKQTNPSIQQCIYMYPPMSPLALTPPTKLSKPNTKTSNSLLIGITTESIPVRSYTVHPIPPWPMWKNQPSRTTPLPHVYTCLTTHSHEEEDLHNHDHVKHYELLTASVIPNDYLANLSIYFVTTIANNDNSDGNILQNLPELL